jgi:hypothetical protein
MAEYVGGAAGYIKFGSTVLSSDYRTFEPVEEIGLVESQAGNDTTKTYLTVLKDGTTPISLVDQTGGSALWTAVVPGTSGTLEWGPEGTASGKPKHTVTALVKNRKRSQPYDGIVVLDVSFQFSGAVTDGAY